MCGVRACAAEEKLGPEPRARTHSLQRDNTPCKIGKSYGCRKGFPASQGASCGKIGSVAEAFNLLPLPIGLSVDWRCGKRVGTGLFQPVGDLSAQVVQQWAELAHATAILTSFEASVDMYWAIGGAFNINAPKTGI